MIKSGVVFAIASVLLVSACQTNSGSGAAAGVSSQSATVVRDKYRETPAGQEIELGNYAYWNRKCEGVPFEMQIRAEPPNGTYRIDRDIYAVPEVTTFGKGECKDQIVKSKKLTYVPPPGFKGVDTLSVYVESRGNSVLDTYKIEVY